MKARPLKTLDRALSKAGLGSRTEARSWIGAGRVSVNGRVIQTPDHWVDLERDKIALDGKPIQESEKVYLLLYKPKGYLTTYKDPEGRPTVYDLLPDLKSWVFLVAITVPIYTADHVFTICHNLHKTNVNLPKSPSKFWTGDIQSSQEKKMVSNLKSETARANGAKSRGPTTAEGKEKSSRNSIKHGLTAGNGNILLDCEDPDEFDEIFNNLLGIHEPPPQPRLIWSRRW